MNMITTKDQVSYHPPFGTCLLCSVVTGARMPLCLCQYVCPALHEPCPRTQLSTAHGRPSLTRVMGPRPRRGFLRPPGQCWPLQRPKGATDSHRAAHRVHIVHRVPMMHRVPRVPMIHTWFTHGPHMVHTWSTHGPQMVHRTTIRRGLIGLIGLRGVRCGERSEAGVEEPWHAKRE